jgi:hypothetical protein
LLLPPSTKIGPITGGASFTKGNQYLIRKYIFPVLYKISEKIINFRYKNILFTTSLLKQYLSKETVKKSNFNFIFNYIKINKIKKKNIDFLIYFREHHNKKSLFPYYFINKLVSLGFEIHIVGDYFEHPYVQNHGHINNKQINGLLSRSFFSLISNENPYTIFTIECINNHVKIIVDKIHKEKIKYYKKSFIFLDFKKKINKDYLLKSK